MEKTEGLIKPLFSVAYFNDKDEQIGTDTPIEECSSIQIAIRINDLIEDKNMGTAVLRGFMAERTDEMVRVINLIRAKKANSKNKILTPGMNKAGLHALQ